MTAAAVVAESRFRAMGTDCQVLLHADPWVTTALLEWARARVDELEQRWSRFRPTSEVCELNRDGGTRPVSADTLTVLDWACQAYLLTGGLFDVTAGARLATWGYDRTFARVGGSTTVAVPLQAGSGAPLPAGPRTAGDELVVDAVRGLVGLPDGAAVDLGGIGKGAAADLVATELVGHGAAGAVVNLGGDLRVAGDASTAGGCPDGWGWHLDVAADSAADPLGLASYARLCLAAGAAATSSPHGRQWLHEGRQVHHLVDPRTGAPAVGGPTAVTVLAGEAWQAEAVATAACLVPYPAAAEVIEKAGLCGFVVYPTGVYVEVGAVGDFRHG